MQIVVQNHSESINTDWINSQFNKFALTMDEAIPVIFFPNKEAFDTALGISSPPWVVATQDENNIYIVDPSEWNPETCTSSIEEIIAHEATHVFHQRTRPDVELWIFEGFAMLVADQIASMNGTKVTLINPFELTYENDNFYVIVGQIMSKLIAKHGSERVIQSILTTDSYQDDPILGTNAILEILK